jgi:hypothetical protein
MGTPGSPPTKLMVVPDKWVRPTRRPTDLIVAPTDLVGGPRDLLKTFQKIPRMILSDLVGQFGMQDKAEDICCASRQPEDHRIML